MSTTNSLHQLLVLHAEKKRQGHTLSALAELGCMVTCEACQGLGHTWHGTSGDWVDLTCSTCCGEGKTPAVRAVGWYDKDTCESMLIPMLNFHATLGVKGFPMGNPAPLVKEDRENILASICKGDETAWRNLRARLLDPKDQIEFFTHRPTE